MVKFRSAKLKGESSTIGARPSLPAQCILRQKRRQCQYSHSPVSDATLDSGFCVIGSIITHGLRDQEELIHSTHFKSPACHRREIGKPRVHERKNAYQERTTTGGRFHSSIFATQGDIPSKHGVVNKTAQGTTPDCAIWICTWRRKLTNVPGTSAWLPKSKCYSEIVNHYSRPLLNQSRHLSS